MLNTLLEHDIIKNDSMNQNPLQNKTMPWDRDILCLITEDKEILVVVVPSPNTHTSDLWFVDDDL